MLAVEPLVSDEEWQHWGRFGEAAELLYREINAALVARHSLAVPDVHLLNLLNEDSRRRLRMGTLADALVLAPRPGDMAGPALGGSGIGPQVS
ncbi:hypothetical protein [Mycolicibacterium fortuitum]